MIPDQILLNSREGVWYPSGTTKKNQQFEIFSSIAHFIFIEKNIKKEKKIINDSIPKIKYMKERLSNIGVDGGGDVRRGAGCVYLSKR